jgi:hypothetical protein
MPVRSVAPVANARTVTSTSIESARGTRASSAAGRPSTPHIASRRPIPPPAAASTRLSVASCLRIRRRPAPRAERMAISRSREVVRASIRFATLAHAMSSSNPTVASRIMSAGRASPTSCSYNGSTVIVAFALVVGYVFASCSPIASISPCACARVTPGFNRPTTLKMRSARFFTCAADVSMLPIAVQSWNSALGKRNQAGATPMIVYELPLSSMPRPRTDGSAPKRDCHNPYPRTTVRSRSSSAANVRPRAGMTPSSGSSSRDTTPPRICCVSSSVRRLYRFEAQTAVPSNDREERWTSL